MDSLEDVLYFSIFLVVVIVGGAIGGWILHLFLKWHVKSQLKQKNVTELKLRNMYSTYNNVMLWVYFFMLGIGGAAIYYWKFRDQILDMIRANMQGRGYKTKSL